MIEFCRFGQRSTISRCDECASESIFKMIKWPLHATQPRLFSLAKEQNGFLFSSQCTYLAHRFCIFCITVRIDSFHFRNLPMLAFVNVIGNHFFNIFFFLFFFNIFFFFVVFLFLVLSICFFFFAAGDFIFPFLQFISGEEKFFINGM